MNENVAIQNGSITLQGTLTLPAGEKKFPLLVVSHTSNAGMRDYCAYNHLAKVLPEKGVAVFVFDRRGCGESSGILETASFYDLADDLKSVVATLKLRDDIDEDRIGLWGMSQGGWIAPLAASEFDDIQFVVAVSAPAVSPAEQMNYSSSYALKMNHFPEYAINKMLALRAVVDDYYRDKVTFRKAQQWIDLYRNEDWFPLAYLDETLPKTVEGTKWRQEMDFDPLPVIQKIKVPMLLVFGETDPWVDVEQSIEIWTKFGRSDVAIERIANANHFMVSIAEFGVEQDTGDMVDEYTRILVGWISRQLALPNG